MKQTVVLNIVGLSSALLQDENLFITQWINKKQFSTIKPMLPAVTCAVQSTYLTGQWPNQHGIVANGWYFKEECEVKLWRQSNHLVQTEKIWDIAKKQNPNFTCSNMFWWYNMYSNSDYNVTPRPQYWADGQKKPDCYSQPAHLRDRLQDELGTFPLFNFWGPNTSIKSTKWIAEASKLVHQWHEPTLQLVYLPHLDYVLQKTTDVIEINKDLKALDDVLKDLIGFYENKGINPIIVSEYGITPVKKPIHVNRFFRTQNLLEIREERGLELLDAGMCEAFAMADHQIAHVYIKNPNKIEAIAKELASIQGIALILNKEEQIKHHINHHRSGDLVLMADKDHWFTYYYWLDDKKAPDFARMVDIHKKPGYDPVELFTDPEKKFMTTRIIGKLIKKKLGFRSLLNIIPLNANLVAGSHGSTAVSKDYFPIIACNKAFENNSQSSLEAVDVFDIIMKEIFDD